jgi:gamma-glutamylcysteine synthetase
MEKPTQALRRRGVRYIEVRSFDVNAFEPAGVSAEQLHFMDAFIRFCFLADSPRIDARERRAIDDNLVLTAHRGREPGLRLERAGQATPLRDWALVLLDAMTAIAEWVDGGPGGPCVASLHRQRAGLTRSSEDLLLSPAVVRHSGQSPVVRVSSASVPCCPRSRAGTCARSSSNPSPRPRKRASRP